MATSEIALYDLIGTLKSMSQNVQVDLDNLVHMPEHIMDQACAHCCRPARCDNGDIVPGGYYVEREIFIEKSDGYVSAKPGDEMLIKDGIVSIRKYGADKIIGIPLAKIDLVSFVPSSKEQHLWHHW